MSKAKERRRQAAPSSSGGQRKRQMAQASCSRSVPSLLVLCQLYQISEVPGPLVVGSQACLADLSVWGTSGQPVPTRQLARQCGGSLWLTLPSSKAPCLGDDALALMSSAVVQPFSQPHYDERVGALADCCWLGGRPAGLRDEFSQQAARLRP